MCPPPTSTQRGDLAVLLNRHGLLLQEERIQARDRSIAADEERERAEKLAQLRERRLKDSFEEGTSETRENFAVKTEAQPEVRAAARIVHQRDGASQAVANDAVVFTPPRNGSQQMRRTYHSMQSAPSSLESSVASG